GKDPKILKSGRNDEAYYRRMWQALNDTGQWQDEMWNRRKDGQEFAEWLTINTIHDAQGKVMRRVAIFSDITERKRSEDIIWRQANYDALTSLPNRRLFRDRLDQEVDKARRTSGTAFLALLFIDLDRFKDVNDTLGHEVGDRLLIEAAQRIGACVRSSDTVARLGGDEFTVILPAMDETSRVEQVAQAIIRALSNPFRLGAKEPVYISASVGITLYPGDAEDSQTLLKTADQAMYAAKNQGRNRFSYFTQSLQDAAQSRLQINNDLWFALARNQFELYYQPILELASGRIVKAEALLRWRHPERGMISPAEFIPLAEENGLITDIGDWVFRQAALAARRWRDLGQRDIKVSVNKSPRQFQAGNTQEAWPEFLNEIGLSAECLVIEITEGLLLENRPEVAEKLLAFRDAGIEIALDDFGTGYSAMSYLKKFHIDYLKIDQSFVRDMGHDPADRAIAEAIIVMAHKLGLKVIAEGVETIAQRDLLTTAGCDYGQGYLFARPLPAAEFEALLTAHVPVGLAQD
ncbi:MAG: EAL domain-containing protein, partial [Zoogloea sp.]|nr:EAL domain-containing protein [Zoogloea sp.]